MLSLHETIFDQSEADAAIAEARATFDRDPAALDAVALASFECWATPEQRARANGQPATAKPVLQVTPAAPARKAKQSTVFGSFGAPKAIAIPDRKTLLAELAQRIGGGMAHRYRNKTAEQLMDVLAKIKTHSPRDMSASWSRTFAKCGVEVTGDTKAPTNATRREEIAAGSCSQAHGREDRLIHQFHAAE
jgi:hypothetical protein